jgi:hypothetical protein
MPETDKKDLKISKNLIRIIHSKSPPIRKDQNEIQHKDNKNSLMNP